MNNLKIYLQDYGVYGLRFTVAENLEKAIEKLKEGHFYDPTIEIEEFEVKDGLTYINYGDS